jgi:hypothetical protein
MIDEEGGRSGEEQPSPGVDALRHAASVSPDQLRTPLVRLELEAKEKAVELQGRQDFFNLRKQWSLWLIIWITGLLAFHVVLTLAIGIKLLDYAQYQWFLPMVVAQNFLQIVGMGFVVVKFLYESSSSLLRLPKGSEGTVTVT